MRILHVTDLHAQRACYAWLVNEAPRYDLICFTGDLLDEISRVPLAYQIRDVCEWLRPISTPLAICRGNHDVADDVRRNGDWMRALTGNQRWIDEPRFSFGGFSFASCGWAITLPADLAVDVVLAHAPPVGTATARTRRGQDFGDLAWDGMLDGDRAAPRIMLTGHVHEPESWSAKVGGTWIFNPGLAESRGPNHVILDTDRRIARWIVNGLTSGQVKW